MIVASLAQRHPRRHLRRTSGFERGAALHRHGTADQGQGCGYLATQCKKYSRESACQQLPSLRLVGTDTSGASIRAAGFSASMVERMSRSGAMDPDGAQCAENGRHHRSAQRPAAKRDRCLCRKPVQRNLEYRLSGYDRRQIDAFERAQSSLLILTRYNDTARSFRAFFQRRLPLWEGHTRPGLEKLVDAIADGQGDSASTGGRSRRVYGRCGQGIQPVRIRQPVREGSGEGARGNCRGKPANIQELARFLAAEADHRGVAKMLRRLSELTTTDCTSAKSKSIVTRVLGSGAPWRFRYRRQWFCGDYPPPNLFTAEAARESHQHHPQSEGSGVRQRHHHALRRKNFPDKLDARCLLYVALSRAKSRLMLVVSRNNPSPLLNI